MTKVKKISKVRNACKQAFKDMQAVYPKPICNLSALQRAESTLREYRNLLTT